MGGREGRAGGPRQALPDARRDAGAGGTFLLLLLHDNKPHDVAEILGSRGLETDAIIVTRQPTRNGCTC